MKYQNKFNSNLIVRGWIYKILLNQNYLQNSITNLNLIITIND